jgi:transcriptional regulator with XRE-family HTH domain
MNFADRLKSLRKKHNLDRDRLAEILGLTYSAIAKYETGARKADQDTLNEIADFFKVSTDYLLGRIDDEKSMISIAFEDGGESLTPDEEEHLEEELRRYRELKERFMREKNRDNS